jgi:hypothetical protein
MKYVNLFQVITQIGPLIGSENSERQADQRPDMDGLIRSMKMMPDIMDLGMAVMATGNTIVSSGGNNLVKFQFTVGPAFFRISCLKKAAAAAATIVVRFVRGHFDNIFLADHRFDNKPQIISHWVSESLAHDLTGILNGEFDFQILIPIGVDL